MVRFLAAFVLLAVVPIPRMLGQDSDSISVSRTRATPPPSSSPSPLCVQDLRSDPNSGVVVSEVLLEGTTVGSSELSSIKHHIEGACLDEQSELIEEMIRAAFQDHGFAQVEVENTTLKAADTLAIPKPVTVKADITEGPRFRFGAIRFTGNRAFSDAKLRAAFPIKKGDLFKRSKIKAGLAEIQKLYVPKGYEDLVFEPGIMFAPTGTVGLTIAISEGPQYHMGELKIYAKKEESDRLASAWSLQSGMVFDGNYPEKFLDGSHSLPPEVGEQNIVLVRNCPEASIAVLLIVDQTDAGLQNPPKDVKCKKTDNTD